MEDSGRDSAGSGGIPGYVNLAAGLGRATRDRASAAVRGLLSQAGLEEAADNASERIAKLTDEVLAASRANRELMMKLIAGEVEKVADQLGFARKEDLDTLRREVADLRVGLAYQSAQAEKIAEQSPAEKSPAEKSPAEKSPAKKSPAKKSPAKKSPASKAAQDSVAQDFADTKPAARKTAAKKTAAKKTAAKKAADKKTAAKKPAAEKSAAQRTPANTSAAESAAQSAESVG